MNMNGYKLKSDSELTEYQKRIDDIENVILCMAEAERMVSEIGKTLSADIEVDAKKVKSTGNKGAFSWNGRKVSPR
ncbi:MAG: hypothetical protein WCG29_02250 [Desulfomonile sp.]|jgi:hypothetical protein|nr:hypothetical protein [Deltaproteobacteria bacterium]